MGGYESRLSTPAGGTSALTAPTTAEPQQTPARVQFSPDLLRQLQLEQEKRVQQRPVPQIAKVQDDFQEAERQRLERLQRERLQSQQRERERIVERQEEEAASQNTLAFLERMEKRGLVATPKRSDNKNVNANNVCIDEARKISALLEGSRVEELFKQLSVYEECVHRESARTRVTA